MRTKKTFRTLALASAGLLALAAPQAPLDAQGVTYVTVTKPEMSGAMGMVARLAPGALGLSTVTTAMQGTFYRTDEGEATSTIIDLAAKRYTFLDHGERTYYSVSFEEMMAQAEAAMAQLSEAQPSAGGAPPIEVERTGKTQTIEGVTAEQLVMWMEPAAGGQPQAEGMGSMAFVSEIWYSKDFPGYEELMKAQEAMGAGAAGLDAALAGDPAMAEWGKRLAEEMKGLEGIPVRTVTSMVMVPPGATFDREAVLAAGDKPSEGGGGASAANAARQALGGLMGRGRRQQQEQPAPDAAPTQSVFMRVIQTVQDVKTGAIPDERFQVPAGYREMIPGK